MVALHIFRIAQEAVGHALKHSRADEVVIRFESGARLTVSITDNGNGIPAQRNGGYGLRNMEERAAEGGMSFRIAAASPKGTVVEIIWQPQDVLKK